MTRAVLKRPIAKVTRVAIYVRQSVEDTTSDFGSLVAQREAVAAYVLSQKGEGWAALPERYEDAGFSGATTQRPAFQRLLRDIDAGHVDIVAVYKLDRLSRSLADFVGLMNTFRAKGVDFVSVTQQFTTTNPVGRMTLNLLATFAEFEREQISERTRDKMRAARRRGMWTGGPPVLGYDLREKKLFVNPEEAEQIRWIYRQFVELGSIMKVVEVLNARGMRTKSWRAADGKQVQGKPFTKSNLQRLLTNPTYLGLMTVGDEIVTGQHEAIVAQDLADAVKALLRTNRRHNGANQKNRHGLLLRGLITCGICGSSMIHTASERWHYYSCAKLVRQGASACTGRISSTKIESAVIERVRDVGRDPKVVDATLVAARQEREAKLPELIADARRLERDRVQGEKERENLIEAVALGGSAVPTLMNRIAETDAEIEGLAAKIQASKDELVLLQNAEVDEQELRRLLADFDAIWDVMFVKERERVLQLLVLGVTYDGRTGEVEVRIA